VIKLSCHVEYEKVPNKMFTTGIEYAGRECGHNNSCLEIIDNLGHKRIVVKDKLRFIVRNDATISKPYDMIYAYFKIIK